METTIEVLAKCFVGFAISMIVFLMCLLLYLVGDLFYGLTCFIIVFVTRGKFVSWGYNPSWVGRRHFLLKNSNNEFVNEYIQNTIKFITGIFYLILIFVIGGTVFYFLGNFLESLGFSLWEK